MQGVQAQSIWSFLLQPTSRARDAGVGPTAAAATSMRDDTARPRNGLAAVAEQLGLAARVLRWVGRRSADPAPLRFLGRIQLGQRQSLTLVEAEGTRILVGCSTNGGIAFLALGAKKELNRRRPPACAGVMPTMSPTRLKRFVKSRMP